MNLAGLQGPRSSASNLNLIALALRGRSVVFSEFISIIEEIGGLFKAEQVDDDDNEAYCVKSFDKTDDEAKVLAHQFAGHKDTTEDYEVQLSNTVDRIAVVQKSISKLDASVAKASEIRQTQHLSLSL